ncbi:MAG: hypothetical protein OXN89_13145, partial [Bryobacterales bacterium]|nr:hypothetical protein [Bryobacterales bacterium]
SVRDELPHTAPSVAVFSFHARDEVHYGGMPPLFIDDGLQLTAQHLFAGHDLCCRPSTRPFLAPLQREPVPLFDDAPTQPREIGENSDTRFIG